MTDAEIVIPRFGHFVKLASTLFHFSWGVDQLRQTERQTGVQRELVTVAPTISSAQTLAPNDIKSSRWQRPYAGYFGFTLFSGSRDVSSIFYMRSMINTHAHTV